MKTRRIEVTKPIIEDKTTKQVNFGCNRKDGVLSLLRLPNVSKKISLRSVNLKNYRIIFKVLTAISCTLKALDRFN